MNERGASTVFWWTVLPSHLGVLRAGSASNPVPCSWAWESRRWQAFESLPNMGDPDGASGFWLQPGLESTVVAILEVNQWLEYLFISLCLFFYLCNSVFQINKLINFYKKKKRENGSEKAGRSLGFRRIKSV